MLIGKSTIGTVSYMGGVITNPEWFTHAYSQMIQYNSEYLLQPTERINYTRAVVSDHAFARNSLVQQLQGEWLLMLDTDINFEPDLLARMLKLMGENNINVLLCPYVYKQSPHPPVLFGYDYKSHEGFKVGDWDTKTALMPVYSAGAGCLLVKRGVFDLIQEKCKEEPFTHMGAFSEDHSFFQRLWKLKITAYAAMHIPVYHMTMIQYGLEDYDKRTLSIEKKRWTIKPFKS